MAESFSIPFVSAVVTPEVPAQFMQKFQSDPLGKLINRILLDLHDPPSSLDGIARTVGEAFDADCTALIVGGAEPQSTGAREQVAPTATFWYSSDSSRRLSARERAAIERTPWERAIGESDLYVTTDARLGVAAHSVRRLSGMGVRLRGAIAGTLVVLRSPVRHSSSPPLSRRSADDIDPSTHVVSFGWSASDMQKLSAVSEPMAALLEQAIRNRELAAYQQQLNVLTHYQNSIHELTLAIHRGTDVDRILQQALDSLIGTFKIRRGSILMLKYTDPFFKSRSFARSSLRGSESASVSPQDGEISLPPLPRAKVTVTCQSSQSSHSDEDDPNYTPDVGSFWLSDCCWCQQAFSQSPTPLTIADRTDAIARHPDLTWAPIFDPERFPALCIVPLVASSGGSLGHGRILGSIALEHDTPRDWLPQELKLAELIAAQLSTAILQNQTIQQVQALVEERTAQLQRSLDVQGKLYEKTRQQIEQLRKLNQMKDEFLSTLSHELNTPLTSMKVAIQMLRQPGIPPEKQAKYLDILETEWSRESNLVKDLLKLQELESDRATIKLELLDLKRILAALVEPFEQKWADKGLRLKIDLPRRAPKGLAKTYFKLKTDADSLDRILVELLTNAGKYSNPNTTVYLRATHQIEPDCNRAILSLTNIGAGISPEDLPHIFEKFRRGQGVTQQAIGGTGLGLALVKCLVQHLNGAIEVSSVPLAEDSAWKTCFTLTLPQMAETAPT